MSDFNIIYRPLISISENVWPGRKFLLLLPLMFLVMGEQCFSPAQTIGDDDDIQKMKERKPIAIYKQNHLADISADGRLLLFYQTRVPIRTYTIPLYGSPKYANQPPVYDDVLRVVERESGREIARQGVMESTFDTQFIPDTDQIYYAQLKKVKPFGSVATFWDYETGQTKTCLEHNQGNMGGTAFVDNKTAFMPIYDENKSLGQLLTKLDLSSCQTEVIGRIYPLDPNNKIRSNKILGSGITILPYGKLIAYALSGNEKIIFRKTDNPKEIVKEIDSAPLYFWGKTAFTPDGKLMITNAADFRIRNDAVDGPENYYLLIYDMKSFRKVGQIVIPLNEEIAVGSTQIAVSPDSRLVAASYKTVNKGFLGKVEQAHVAIYDISTGKQVGKVSHPQLREKRNDPFQSEINKIVFTAGGKQLLTSTYDTYVWDISHLDQK